MMLVDTDVLIDFLRGRSEAVLFLRENIDRLSISAVSVAELFQGVRDGEERTRLSTMISAFVVLPLTEEIALAAGLYRRDFKATIGCGLADCMIAATAVHHRSQLVSLNAKHFTMVEDVKIPYRKD